MADGMVSRVQQKVTAASPAGNVIPSLELTQWDLARSVVAVQPDRVVSVSQRAIDVELTCPICLSIMDNPYSVMECLHRFCAECINRAIRANIKECPTCRVRIVSKRSLRPDPQFAALIRSFYPDIAEHEAMQQAQLKEILANSPHYRALLRSCEEQQRRQAPRRRAEASPSPPPDGDEAGEPSPTPSRAAKSRRTVPDAESPVPPTPPAEVAVPVRRHPAESRLPEIPDDCLRCDPSQPLQAVLPALSAALPPDAHSGELSLAYAEAGAGPAARFCDASDSRVPLRDLLRAWEGEGRGTLTLYYSLPDEAAAPAADSDSGG